MTTTRTRDWDDAYANMAHIQGSEALPAEWTASAAAYRASGVQSHQDIAYGDHPREVFDLILPDPEPRGLVVFVHGGYWMKLDKSFWTHYAEGARARGWAVAMPSYTLAPQSRLRGITRQIGRAIAAAATQVSGPIRLAGHSAGGHLVTRMLCADSPLPPEVLERIAHTVSISGVHDLRPLLFTAMNDTLRLDAAEATAESAALLMPLGQPSLCAWVGGGERPEFIRQAQLMAEMWSVLGVPAFCHIDGSEHHFSVLDGLRVPQSPLIEELLGG
ncbi:MAG: alpha/beta hydrolase [Alphaproteobacteria bacterium]|nr:alpha/beta hydrolase [Alphaproteobacteria bacterium]